MIGAGFSLAYIRKNGEKFYTNIADNIWFAPAGWFIRKYVVPYPNVFTTTLILFQLLVALALLSQEPYVTFGLLAGTVFSLYGVFVSNVRGAIVNLGLALIQFYLASSK
jgi:hypothetical protein